MDQKDHWLKGKKSIELMKYGNMGPHIKYVGRGAGGFLWES